jgi:hypothetical protein
MRVTIEFDYSNEAYRRRTAHENERRFAICLSIGRRRQIGDPDFSK